MTRLHADIDNTSFGAPSPATDPECECQDTERCPVHFGYE